MDMQEARFFGRSADFDKDVRLANQRSSCHEGARLTAQGPMAGEASFDPSSEDADLEFAAASAVEWIEAQLLDCQNLARQNGLPQLAALLDNALDLLAEKAADAASNDLSEAVILPFRVR